MVRHRAQGKVMSAAWMRKMAGLGKIPVDSGYPPTAEHLAPQRMTKSTSDDSRNTKLHDADWKFDEVPDDELWACLIWEYGRSADWIYGVLPRRNRIDDAKLGHQIGRFHYGDPSKALKILNNMCLWQWIWSQNSGAQKMDYFPDVPWSQLPPIVKANMQRAVDGLEPAANLPLLHKLLKKKNEDDGSGALQSAGILEQLRAFEPPLYTPEEEKFVGEPQRWLPGGNGLDDVTDGVIIGERFLKRLRDGMAQHVAGKITPAEAQNLLQEVVAGEISLLRFRDDKKLTADGYGAVAFRINWKVQNKELIQKFSEWLKDRRPAIFRDKSSGNWKKTRGPDGLELYVLRGGKKKTVHPVTALSSLGSWRKGRAAGDQKSVLALYHPLLSGKKYDSQMASYSRDSRDADFLFDQLFPKSSS
jgi:hypothetical protein